MSKELCFCMIEIFVMGISCMWAYGVEVIRVREYLGNRKAVVRNVSEEFDAAFGIRCEVRSKQSSGPSSH